MVIDPIRDKTINIKKANCDENIVYILGAGFSAYAGLPVMSNFLSKSKDIYFENPKAYSYFPELFKKFDSMGKIKNYFSTNLFNIEEILSILEMDVAIGNGESDFRDNFIEYIKDVIRYYKFKNDDFRIYKNPEFGTLSEKPFSTNNDVINRYGYFVASLMRLSLFKDKESIYLHGKYLPSKNHYSVITFNYDMIIEQIKTHIESFSSENNEETLSIYKLHGSVDGEIVPPTWAKGISRDMKSVWKGASKKLQEATQIRIVGYSLPITDSYFRYFLKSALLRNSRLKKIDIICYDPSGSVEKNYSDFIDSHFPCYRFMNKKVDDYFYDLMIETRKTGNIELSFDKLEVIHDSFMELKPKEGNLLFG